MYFGPSISVGRRGVSYGDSDAQAFIAATGLTGTTEVNAVNNLVANLKSYGLWSKMKAIYPFVSDQRNLIGYTEDFTNAAWTKSGGTATANTTTAPDGTITADTFTENTANTVHTLYQGFSSITGNQYTFSCYVKDNGRNIVRFECQATSVLYQVEFNLTTVTTSNFSGTGTAAITSVGNGWYRCSATITSTATGTGYWQLDLCSGLGTNTYLGNGTSGVYLWGAQVDLGALTTYQKTVGTPSSVFVQQFKYNLKDARDLDAAFRLAFNGTWTYSKQGATPNGVNAYANTYLIPNTAYSTNNSISLGYYSRTMANPNPSTEMGSANTGLANGVYLIAYVMNNSYNRLTSSSTQTVGITPTTGLYSLTRISSTEFKYFRNTTNLNTAAIASTGRTTNQMWIGGVNYGTSQEYGGGQTSFNFIGDGLTDTEISNLYTSIQSFQTELARQV